MQKKKLSFSKAIFHINNSQKVVDGNIEIFVDNINFIYKDGENYVYVMNSGHYIIIDPKDCIDSRTL